MHYDIYIRNPSRDRNGTVYECVLYIKKNIGNSKKMEMIQGILIGGSCVALGFIIGLWATGSIIGSIKRK